MKTILTETKSFTFCSHSFIQSLICLFIPFFPLFILAFIEFIRRLFVQSVIHSHSFVSFIHSLTHSSIFSCINLCSIPAFHPFIHFVSLLEIAPGILTTMKFALATLVTLLSITWVSSSFLRSKLKLDDFKDEEPWVTFPHYYLFGRVSFFEHLLFLLLLLKSTVV